MASLNKVFLLGNLVRDPDLRGLPSGQSVCELRMAVSRRYVNGSGQETEETCFVPRLFILSFFAHYQVLSVYFDGQTPTTFENSREK